MTHLYKTFKKKKMVGIKFLLISTTTFCSALLQIDRKFSVHKFSCGGVDKLLNIWILKSSSRRHITALPENTRRFRG
jgi:hypothetical protein